MLHHTGLERCVATLKGGQRNRSIDESLKSLVGEQWVLMVGVGRRGFRCGSLIAWGGYVQMDEVEGRGCVGASRVVLHHQRVIYV